MEIKKTAISMMYLLTAIAFISFTGCASVSKGYHKYIMRGQVLEVSDKDIYLCIGSRDGAQVGQEFEVFKNVPVRTVAGPRSMNVDYKKEKTGVVKITEIVDVHYARAVVISGKADRNSVVELEQTVR